MQHYNITFYNITTLQIRRSRDGTVAGSSSIASFARGGRECRIIEYSSLLAARHEQQSLTGL